MTALAHPVMPEATAKIWAQLGLGDITKFDLTQLRWGQLQPGTKQGEVQAVFPRADKSAIERMQKMEEQNATVAAGAPATCKCEQCQYQRLARPPSQSAASKAEPADDRASEAGRRSSRRQNHHRRFR